MSLPRIPIPKDSALVWEPCHNCAGFGVVDNWWRRCPECRGKGRFLRDRIEVTVDEPPSPRTALGDRVELGVLEHMEDPSGLSFGHDEWHSLATAIVEAVERQGVWVDVGWPNIGEDEYIKQEDHWRLTLTDIEQEDSA